MFPTHQGTLDATSAGRFFDSVSDCFNDLPLVSELNNLNVSKISLTYEKIASHLNRRRRRNRLHRGLHSPPRRTCHHHDAFHYRRDHQEIVDNHQEVQWRHQFNLFLFNRQKVIHDFGVAVAF